MNSSILMKFTAMHKSRPKQISFPTTFCLFQILAILSFGQAIDATKPAEPFAIGASLTFDHPDASFVESLLKLGLFDIAIETCRDRFRIAEATQLEAAAQWSMLEMQSIAAKVAADPNIIDNPAAVTNLLAANLAILERNPESSRWLWLKQQQQWCRWLVLRRLQAAYVAVPARKLIREWSLSAVRECLEELESLRSQIQKAPDRNGKTDSKSAPTPEQWTSLLTDTYLLQTDFLLLRALYYPAKSTDRIAAATEMATAIEKAELRISDDWPGRPNLELARCAALIQLDRPADALARIKTLDEQLSATVGEKPKQGNRWKPRMATLAAEACRNLGNLKESNQWINSVGGWRVAPEIAIEHFANLVSVPAGQATSESQLANALQVKKEIGLRFGSYWQQRADAILLANNMNRTSDAANTTGATSENLKVELLMSEAKQLLAAKLWDEAIEKLSQAELVSASIGNESMALDIAIQASAVLFKNGQKETAEGEFHRAAMAYSTQPKAPNAAVMSVYSFDKVLRFDENATSVSPKEEAVALQQQIYRGRLMDIVNTWPNTAQAQQAVTKLDRLLLATDQLTDLLALWSKRLDQVSPIPESTDPNSVRWSDFDSALSRFALVSIATQDAWYDHSIYGSDANKKVQQSLDAMRAKMIELANPNDRSVVGSLLVSMDGSSRWPSRDNRSTIPSNSPNDSLSISLLAQTVAGASFTKTEKLVANLEAAKVDEISKLALQWTMSEMQFQRLIQNGLTNPMNQEDLAIFRSCVDLLNQLESQPNKRSLESIGLLQSMQFSRSMRFYRASLQFWSSEDAVAIKAIQAAIASEPKTPWWTYRTARLFQTLVGQREKAIHQFRQLANGFPAGSEPWLESRARTVQTLRLMGDTKGAKDLTDLVFATYPSAAKEWQTRFEPR